MYYDTK